MYVYIITMRTTHENYIVGQNTVWAGTGQIQAVEYMDAHPLESTQSYWLSRWQGDKEQTISCRK